MRDVQMDPAQLKMAAAMMKNMSPEGEAGCARLNAQLHCGAVSGACPACRARRRSSGASGLICAMSIHALQCDPCPRATP